MIKAERLIDGEKYTVGATVVRLASFDMARKTVYEKLCRIINNDNMKRTHRFKVGYAWFKKQLVTSF